MPKKAILVVVTGHLIEPLTNQQRFLIDCLSLGPAHDQTHASYDQKYMERLQKKIKSGAVTAKRIEGRKQINTGTLLGLWDESLKEGGVRS